MNDDDHHRRLQEQFRRNKERDDEYYRQQKEREAERRRNDDHQAELRRLDAQQRRANKARHDRDRIAREKRDRAAQAAAQAKAQKKADAAAKKAKKAGKTAGPTSPPTASSSTSWNQIFTWAIVLGGAGGSAYLANLQGITSYGLAIAAAVGAGIAYWARTFLKWALIIGAIIFVAVKMFGSESYANSAVPQSASSVLISPILHSVEKSVSSHMGAV